MPVPCSARGCKDSVPAELEREGLCLSHFILGLEEACADIRRETAPATISAERRAQIERYISEQGEKLARVSTGGLRVPDEMKRRLLTTFLTLVNLRENLDRATLRRPPGSKAAG